MRGGVLTVRTTVRDVLELSLVHLLSPNRKRSKENSYINKQITGNWGIAVSDSG